MEFKDFFGSIVNSVKTKVNATSSFFNGIGKGTEAIENSMVTISESMNILIWVIPAIVAIFEIGYLLNSVKGL